MLVPISRVGRLDLVGLVGKREKNSRKIDGWAFKVSLGFVGELTGDQVGFWEKLRSIMTEDNYNSCCITLQVSNIGWVPTASMSLQTTPNKKAIGIRKPPKIAPNCDFSPLFSYKKAFLHFNFIQKWFSTLLAHLSGSAKSAESKISQSILIFIILLHHDS